MVSRAQHRAHSSRYRELWARAGLPSEELLGAEARAREAWLSGRLQELSTEERAVLREAAVIMDKLASG